MKPELKGFWERKKSAKKPVKKEAPPVKQEAPAKKKDEGEAAEKPKPSKNRRAKEKLLESVVKGDASDDKKEEKPAVQKRRRSRKPKAEKDAA